MVALALVGAAAPAAGNPAECWITDHGAIPGDARLDTAAVQAAIDACASRGGGRVVIPAGRFVTGTVRLRSHIELHLGPGAVLAGSPKLSDYPVLTPARADDHSRLAAAPSGEDAHGVRALIVAFDVEGTSLTGEGTIDGQGDAFWGEGFLASGRARPDRPRPRPWIWFRAGRRVTVRDLTLTNSPSYSLTFEGCDDALVQGVRIRNHPLSPNSDGIQVESSQNVRIVGVDIRTGDDAVVLKGSSGPVENVVVTASYLESDDAAFKLGTGSRHPIRRIRLADSVIARSRHGIALFMKDGGEFSDIGVAGVEIATASRHATEYPVYVDVDRRTPESPLGRIRDIALRDLRIRTRGNLLIAGQPGAPLERLTLADIDIRVEGPVDLTRLGGKPRGNALVQAASESADYSRDNAHLTLGHVAGLDLRDVRISGAAAGDAGRRHALLLRDVDRGRLRGLLLGPRSGNLAAILVDGGRGLLFDGLSMDGAQVPVFAFQGPSDSPLRVRGFDGPPGLALAAQGDTGFVRIVDR